MCKAVVVLGLLDVFLFIPQLLPSVRETDDDRTWVAIQGRGVSHVDGEPDEA